MAVRTTASCLAAFLAAASPQMAAAQGQSRLPPLGWQCAQQFDAQFHVLCVPHAPVEALAVRGPVATATEPAEPTRGLANADMRPVAQRGDAEVFSAEAWHVALHSAPSDPRHVVELLESVLCGKRPDCVVRYESAPARLARR